MIIKRTQGIFEYALNLAQEKSKISKEEHARLNYNQMAFLASALIPIIDELKDTTEYQKGLKKSPNESLSHLEKINLKHFKMYDSFGMVEVQGQKMHSKDIHTVTSKAYDKALEFFVTRKPSEILTVMQLLEKAENKGLKLEDVFIEYTPVKK